VSAPGVTADLLRLSTVSLCSAKIFINEGFEIHFHTSPSSKQTTQVAVKISAANRQERAEEFYIEIGPTLRYQDRNCSKLTYTGTDTLSACFKQYDSAVCDGVEVLSDLNKSHYRLSCRVLLHNVHFGCLHMRRFRWYILIQIKSTFLTTSLKIILSIRKFLRKILQSSLSSKSLLL
jgi:hypothetical protein